MAGIVDIKVLLKDMKPVLDKTDYVFCTKKCFKIDKEIIKLNPIGTFIEFEGLTLIVSKIKADEMGFIMNQYLIKLH